jgi:hypothetical protein
VQARKNVILLWDSLDDVQMIDGFPYHHLLKIWFFNSGDEVMKEQFREQYDVLILHDGTLDYVNELLTTLIG